MKKKKLNKIFICLLLLAVSGFSFTSCSDWTDDESIKIKVLPNPDQPKYLENLRAYKATDHKYMYAWFDNSVKAPSSRGQHVGDVADSIDVVVLMYPNALADFEVEEIASLQNEKATKVAYAVNYDAIKKEYDQMVKDNLEADESYIAPVFIPYMQEKVDALLTLSGKYNYNGIVISYKGESTVYMTVQEKEAYIANQEAFLSKIKIWVEANTNKFVVFAGSPQFLNDKTLLSKCKHIILNTADAKFVNELSIAVEAAMEQNVPTDRFIVATNMVSLATSDSKTGYYDTKRATTEAAYWVTEQIDGYNKAGLSIYNIQNDYYNISNVYQHSKTAINIMNPAPVK